MEINLKLEISYTDKEKTINLSDYGMTKEEWQSMTKEDQEDWLYENVIDQFDSPAWVIEKY